jgi:hypothetical protein
MPNHSAQYLTVTHVKTHLLQQGGLVMVGRLQDDTEKTPPPPTATTTTANKQQTMI